jgi:hypothetical protein
MSIIQNSIKNSFFSFALLGSLTLQSCATILTGTSDKITIQSVPPGASIEVDGESMGTTPAIIKVKRNTLPTVSILLDGYEEKQINLHKKFNPAAILNIIIGGIPGLIVDAATGAISKFDKTLYNMELNELSWNKQKTESTNGF